MRSKCCALSLATFQPHSPQSGFVVTLLIFGSPHAVSDLTHEIYMRRQTKSCVYLLCLSRNPCDAPAIDRRTLRSYIDDLHDCVKARQDFLDNNGAIYDQLKFQELRGDRLESQMHDIRDFAEPIQNFVNSVTTVCVTRWKAPSTNLLIS